MSTVPEKLGKYHILGLLAQGGMAEVYRAKTIGIAGFEKTLAVKRIRPRYANEPRFIRNFIDEARIAVTLNHRNIVQVFDFGKADNELFLAMELLEGVDLRKALDVSNSKSIPIPPALSCYILADVSSGLDYAHRKTDASGNHLGIVHCDVSPHNILLSHEGFVKILDFGVARAKFVAAPSSKRLRGKPRYMAPEQTRGDAPSSASDVFVLGILGWELLSGKTLYEGDDIRTILQSVRTSEVPDLATLVPGLPRYLTSSIMKALQKAPLRRGTAADIGGSFAKAGRELSNEPSAQALSKWLITVMATSDDDINEEPTTETKHMAVVSSTTSTSNPSEKTTENASRIKLQEDAEITEALDALEEQEDKEIRLEEPLLKALLDKRRVVVTVLLLNGGIEERRNQLARALCDLAYKRGAVIHEDNPDEVVSIFGLEIAGEDNIASAMHFAMDAISFARDTTSSDLGEQIVLRSASRARVVAQRKERSYQLRGSALQEARELARNAEPGHPLLSGGTGRLASSQLLFREISARRFRSKRLRVLELIGPIGHHDRTRALRDRRGTFIGRQKELNLLWETYKKTDTNQGARVILITGAAGTGKSRLVTEFVAKLDETQSASILLAIAATEHAVDAPFSVVVDYLQAALQLDPTRGKEARATLLQSLATTLKKNACQPEEILEHTLAIEQAMEIRDGALVSTEQGPTDLRRRCALAIRQTHFSISGMTACAIVIENIHLADKASLEVLRLSIELTPDQTGTLIIATGQNTDSVKSFMLEQPVVLLQELTPVERRNLIEDRLADVCTEELIHEVEQRAGGNPLFIEELCRNIREVGWEEMPATIRDTVIAVVDRQSPTNRAILQRASVVGGSFRARILEELIGAPAHKNLQELLEEGLLLRSDQAEFEAEGGEYKFRHGLIQEVMYASLSASAKKATHAKLGKILSLRQQAGRDEPPVLIARHLELGGQQIESARYWVKAGRIAQSAFEAQSAQKSFTTALRLVQELPDSSNEQKIAIQVDALLGRAKAYRSLNHCTAEEADLQSLTPLVQYNKKAKAELLCTMAERELKAGHLAACLKQCMDAEQLATKIQEPLFIATSLRIRGNRSHLKGDLEEGLELSGRALSIFESLGAISQANQTRIHIAQNHVARSRYAEALSMYAQFNEESKKQSAPWIVDSINNHLAMIYLYISDYKRALTYAQKNLKRPTEGKNSSFQEKGTAAYGAILQEFGQFREAREYFQATLQKYNSSHSKWHFTNALLQQGVNECMLGNVQNGIQQIKSSLHSGVEFNSPELVCKCQIALAKIYLHSEIVNLAKAESLAKEAAAQSQACALSGLQASALSLQALAMHKQGCSARALVISRSAINILNRLHHIEDSEQELLFTHYQLLQANNSPTPDSYLDRASVLLEKKLDQIENHDWKRSFCQNIVCNAQILEALEHWTSN